MPTYRARLFRFLIRYSIGRKLRRAGLSEADRRKLDDLMVRSQRLPRATKVSPVTVCDLPGSSCRRSLIGSSLEESPLRRGLLQIRWSARPNAGRLRPCTSGVTATAPFFAPRKRT